MKELSRDLGSHQKVLQVKQTDNTALQCKVEMYEIYDSQKLEPGEPDLEEDQVRVRAVDLGRNR